MDASSNADNKAPVRFLQEPGRGRAAGETFAQTEPSLET
jgi:hypothetical protein